MRHAIKTLAQLNSQHFHVRLFNDVNVIAGDLVRLDSAEGWQTLARGGIDLREVLGTHLNLIKEPQVGELAKQLNDCLPAAQLQSRRVS